MYLHFDLTAVVISNHLLLLENHWLEGKKLLQIPHVSKITYNACDKKIAKETDNVNSKDS